MDARTQADRHATKHTAPFTNVTFRVVFLKHRAHVRVRARAESHALPNSPICARAHRKFTALPLGAL